VATAASRSGGVHGPLLARSWSTLRRATQAPRDTCGGEVGYAKQRPHGHTCPVAAAASATSSTRISTSAPPRLAPGSSAARWQADRVTVQTQAVRKRYNFFHNFSRI
jgi:hypothetical protein